MISEILKDRLYLGDYETIKSETERFPELGITDIINVASEVSFSSRVKAIFEEHGIQTYKFPLHDVDDHHIQRVMGPIVDLMHMLLSVGQRVYVHCYMGVSRSASVIIAYLVLRENMTVSEAYDLVKASRPMINPPEPFLERLRTATSSGLHPVV